MAEVARTSERKQHITFRVISEFFKTDLLESLVYSLHSTRRDNSSLCPSCYLSWVPFHSPYNFLCVKGGHKFMLEQFLNTKILYLISTLVSFIQIHDNLFDSSHFFLVLLLHKLSLEKPLLSVPALSALELDQIAFTFTR